MKCDYHFIMLLYFFFLRKKHSIKCSELKTNRTTTTTKTQHRDIRVKSQRYTKENIINKPGKRKQKFLFISDYFR